MLYLNIAEYDEKRRNSAVEWKPVSTIPHVTCCTQLLYSETELTKMAKVDEKLAIYTVTPDAVSDSPHGPVHVKQQFPKLTALFDNNM